MAKKRHMPRKESKPKYRVTALVNEEKFNKKIEHLEELIEKYNKVEGSEKQALKEVIEDEIRSVPDNPEFFSFEVEKLH